MNRKQFIAETRRLGPYAHLATTTPAGKPHVVPIHLDWHDGYLYAMVGRTSVKTRNLMVNPHVCLHYQVSQETGWDSLMLWGTGTILESIDDKRRLWTGVLSYDLDLFSEGSGPDDSPDAVFLQITVDRAVLLRNFGMEGREEWRPAGS